MAKSKPRVESGIILPDIHVPFHDKKALRAVTRYIKDRQPDRIIQLGDFMDFDFISKYNVGNARSQEGRRIAKDYAEGNLVWDQIQNAAPSARYIQLEGNHCARIQKYVDANPAVEGMVELQSGLNMGERGIEFIPSWSQGEVYTWGKANFIHGLYTNDHYAKKHVEVYGSSIFFGHTHSIQLYSKVTKGSGKTRVGQSFGCLCEYQQPYIQGRPTNWQQAIGEFYVLPDGSFRYNVHMIFNAVMVIGGEIYDGNKN